MSLILLFLFGLSINAQVPMVNPDSNKKLGSTAPSQKMTLQCKGFVNPSSADLKWRPLLTNKFIESEPQVPNQELIEKIKTEKHKIKQKKEIENKITNSELSIQSVTPIVGTNYLGNTNNGYSPLDNNIAISNGGYIVSVANGTIEYDNMNGTNLYYNNLLTLVNAADASITGVCDPVVIYDSGSDRFIFFCQQTPLVSNSKIFIFFSKSNNPLNGWWLYEFTGDPTGNGDAFDYPKIAVSTNELFLTGNLFTEPANTSHQAIIFQIDKLAGYNGTSLNYNYYVNITGSPFTLLPISYGQSGTYGPGIFLVSTDNAGSSTIHLFQITDLISNSPVLNNWDVSTNVYSVATDASQMGTSCLLKTNDCRALSGFYLYSGGVGTIHFVFHSDIGSGWNGINYNRLVVNTLTNTTASFGSVGSFDYCYPSVVSYATSPADNSVMINFGRSSSSIYPEMRVVNCDNGMNWSGSTLVKSSTSYVTFTSTTGERWGDYTGASRKNNSSTPSIWICGSFGNSSHQWDTWIAEIHNGSGIGINEISKENSLKVFPNPIINVFNVNLNLYETSNLVINIVDINGKLIKDLYHGKGLAGENNFSFNKANLNKGTYFLIIKDEKSILKNEKIIIVN